MLSSFLNGGFLQTALNSCSSCPPYNPSARTAVENLVSNSTSTLARGLLSREPVCLRSLPRKECCFRAVRLQRLFLWLHSSCFEQICHNI
jgi:hypothetical protein